MKKLILNLAALALMIPIPISAIEVPINEEPMTEVAFNETSLEDIEIPEGISRDEFIFFQSYFTFEYIDITTNEIVAQSSYRPHWWNVVGQTYPAISFEEYIYHLSPVILENYTFVEDLPSLDESHFTFGNTNPVQIKVKPREASSLTVLDETLPVRIHCSFPPYSPDGSTVEMGFEISSPNQVGLTLQNETISLDEGLFLAELSKYDSEYGQYKLVNNSFSSEKLVPVIIQDKILFYFIHLPFRNGTYEEIKDTAYQWVHFLAPGQENTSLSCQIPLNILCPSDPEGENYVLDQNAVNRISDYINQNDSLKFSSKDYSFSFEIDAPQTYSLAQNSISIEGRAKVSFTKFSDIMIYPLLEDHSLTEQANCITLFDIVDDDLSLSLDKLNQVVKDYYWAYEVDTDKLSSFDLSQPQDFNTSENPLGLYFFPIPVKPIDEESRNNTIVGVRFMDKTLKFAVGNSENIMDDLVLWWPWKDFFKSSDVVGDTLTLDNMNPKALEKLPSDFEIVNPDFSYSFYSIGLIDIEVKSKNGYSFDDLVIDDWGDDLNGNPRFFLKWKGYELNEWDHYDVSWSSNNLGQKVGTFTGKNGFEGKLIHTFKNEPAYVVRFSIPSIYGWTTSIKDFILKENSMSASINDYLREIPTGYAYAKKPIDLLAQEFKQPTYGNRRHRRVEVEMVKLPTQVDWKFDDEGVKILVPYQIAGENEVKGVLTFSKKDLTSDLKSISKEAINKKLLGYEVTTDFSLSSIEEESIIGYKNGQSFSVLECQSRSPLIVQKATQAVNENATIFVSLGSGSVEISLDHFKEESSSNDSFQITAENLKMALETTLNDLAQKVIDEVLSPSTPGNPDEEKTSYLPNYTFEIEDNLSQDLISTEVDLGSNTQQPQVTIKVAPQSYIRLRFIATEKTETAQYETFALPMSLSLDSEMSWNNLVEVKNEVTEIIQDSAIVQVEQVADNQVLKADKVKDYLGSQGLDLHLDSFRMVDLSGTQDLSMINPETGYIEIDIPVVSEETSSNTPNPTPDDSSVSNPSTGSGGGGSKPSAPAEPEETKPSTSGTVGKKTLYRFYNKLTGEHFFTSDKNERDTLLNDEAWSNEGHGWTTPEVSNYPIYRLCNPNNGDHHYTMDKNEYDTLQNTYGWIGEGVGLYSAGEEDESIVLLHRLYNPNAAGAGSHHYTADENERDELVKRGWSYEGTAWYGLTDSES